MKNNNVCIVGAGSSYTPGIVKAILNNKKSFSIKEIRLYDIDQERNQNMKLIIDYLMEVENRQEIKIIETTDPKTAFENIDFVFSQIRVGKMKMREMDEKICLKHGLVGQETCGLGGFAYGLRTISGIIGMIEDVKKYAPDAWILNYSNPETIVGEVVRRKYPDTKMINVCDMTISLEETIAQNYGYDQNNWICRYYGLNHFGWYESIYDKDLKRDIMPELIEKMRTTELQVADFNSGDQSWIKTFKMMKLLVSNFPDSIPNNYLEYYLYPDKAVENSDVNYTRANMVMDGREKRTLEVVEKIKSGIQKPEDINANYGEHGQYIVDIATSILNDENKRFMLIAKNDGAIPNLRADAVVEIPAYVGATGVEKISLEGINDFHKGMMEAQVAAEKLLVDAYFENSYEKALQAFTLNLTVPNATIAKIILDEMIVVNKDYWPQLNKNVFKK